MSRPRLCALLLAVLILGFILSALPNPEPALPDCPARGAHLIRCAP